MFVQTFKLDTNFSIMNKLIYPLSIQCGEINKDLVVIQFYLGAVFWFIFLSLSLRPPFTPNWASFSVPVGDTQSQPSPPAPGRPWLQEVMSCSLPLNTTLAAPPWVSACYVFILTHCKIFSNFPCGFFLTHRLFMSVWLNSHPFVNLLSFPLLLISMSSLS